MIMIIMIIMMTMIKNNSCIAMSILQYNLAVVTSCIHNVFFITQLYIDWELRPTKAALSINVVQSGIDISNSIGSGMCSCLMARVMAMLMYMVFQWKKLHWTVVLSVLCYKSHMISGAEGIVDITYPLMFSGISMLLCGLSLKNTDDISGYLAALMFPFWQTDYATSALLT